MRLLTSLAGIGLLVFSHGLLAGPRINTTLFGNKAIEGYDPVAYFTVGRPLKGDKRYVHELHGAKWYFSSGENLAKFQQDPQRYLPQYGGYCAYAVGAKNSLAGIDPDAWSIVDGKLYLNYSAAIRETWNEKQAQYIRQGDLNWPALSGDD